MKFIGYVVILFSIFGLLINGYSLMTIQRVRKDAVKEIDKGNHEQFDATFSEGYAPLLEYHGGLLVYSIGALPIGIYIAMQGATFSELIGFVLLLLSLSGLVQSYRKSNTQIMLYKANDYETSAHQMIWKLRIVAILELALGLYLIS